MMRETDGICARKDEDVEGEVRLSKRPKAPGKTAGSSGTGRVCRHHFPSGPSFAGFLPAPSDGCLAGDVAEPYTVVGDSSDHGQSDNQEQSNDNEHGRSCKAHVDYRGFG
jgi:hypothetical protein